jgi:hypothetical protein
MRTLTKTLAALGFVGALAVGTAAPTLAQGVYFSGPGVSVGVGDGWRGYGYRHRDYRHYGYYDDGPYWHRRHAYRYYDRW